MPWYRDLELEHHGVRYLEPELIRHDLRDGRASKVDRPRPHRRILCRVFETRRRALGGWRRNSNRSWKRFSCQRRSHRRWSRGCAADCWNVPRSPAAARNLRGVPLEFVTQQFENDACAGLLFFNGLREVDLRLKGFGHSIPALLASRTKAQWRWRDGQPRAWLVADITQHGAKFGAASSFAASSFAWPRHGH